nr:porin [uncultured Roseateles sp.]
MKPFHSATLGSSPAALSSAMALAMALCSAGAQAQVSLSGFVDVNLESIKSGGSRVTRVSSGGTSVSRLEFRAEEDLGGGLKARAVHELTFTADNGVLAGVPRETYVQLSSTQWGELTLGRLNLPSYWMYGYADPIFAGSYSLVNNLMVFYAPYRESNSVAYTSPRVNGVQVRLGATAGKEDGSRNGDVISTGIDYREGPLYLGLVSDRKYQRNIFAADVMEKSTDTYLVGVYRAGPADLTFIYSRYSGYYAFPPYADFKASGSKWQLGLRYNFGISSRFIASVVSRGTDNNEALSKVTGVLVGYQHGLSKRTQLYANVVSIKHAHASDLRYPVTFSAPGPLGDENPRGLQIGIRHGF